MVFRNDKNAISAIRLIESADDMPFVLFGQRTSDYWLALWWYEYIFLEQFKLHFQPAHFVYLLSLRGIECLRTRPIFVELQTGSDSYWNRSTFIVKSQTGAKKRRKWSGIKETYLWWKTKIRKEMQRIEFMNNNELS